MTASIYDSLPYILPIQDCEIEDECIAITARHFNALYGDIIRRFLQEIMILPSSEEYIKKDNLQAAIKKIMELIDLSDKYCQAWEKDGNLSVMSATKLKPNGKEIWLEQRKQNLYNPRKFLSEKKQKPNFNANCIITMGIQSLLILFDKVLRQVRSMKNDTTFELNVARLFNIIDATNQIHKYYRAFVNRQPRKKGANKSAKAKNAVRETVYKIVKDIGLKSRDATNKQLPYTTQRVKSIYKQVTNSPFPFDDKIMNSYILDSLNNNPSS